MKWRSPMVNRLTLNDITAKGSVQVWSDSDINRVDHWRPILDRLAIPHGDLLDRMCPIQGEHQQCHLLVLAECADDNEVKAVLLAIRQAGLVLGEPNVMLVPPAVLGEINRRFRVVRHPKSVVRAPSIPKHVLFALLDDLLLWALDACASDLHLTLHSDLPHADIAFTVNGLLVRPSQFQSVQTQMVNELLSVAWMSMRGGNGAVFDPGREQQGRLDRQVKGVSVGLRWASLVTAHGPSVCLRILNPKARARVPELGELGYPPEQLTMLERATSGDGGVVIFAGMVGSGKSTTLASLVRTIPRCRKVITLEDPVEYVIENALQCLVTSLEEHSEGRDLAGKLKTIKRSAVHDVLIGEIRDRTGGQALVDLVLSGISVYTTLHASSVFQIMLRLTSAMIGVPPSLAAMPGVIKLLVYQALLPKLCFSCALPSDQWLAQTQTSCALGRHRSRQWFEQWLSRLVRVTGVDPTQVRFRCPEGCPHCQLTVNESLAGHSGYLGYSGRLMLAEMIEPAAESVFFASIAKRGLSEQVAEWQSSLLYEGVCELNHYLPVRSRAIHCLSQGVLDPRDFECRFGAIR